MRAVRTRIRCFTVLLLAVANFAGAQDTGRGSTPPGTSQDGSGAADGAIKGGAIQPGERSGVPSNAPANPTATQRAEQRCRDLTGTLREQCLRDLDSGSGATSGPAGPAGRSPRNSPPPQNPR